MELSFEQQITELGFCLKEQYDEATADTIIFSIILDYLSKPFMNNNDR